jgi:hypothetical protein
MMNTVKRTPIAAGMLILLAAVLIMLPTLDRSVREGVESAVRAVKTGFENIIGLELSFDSLSPSILRSASITKLEISAPGGRHLLEARKVHVYYDFFALITGNTARAVTGLGLVDVSMNLRIPQDLPLIRRLSALFSGESGGPMPKIRITGESVDASIAVDGVGFGAIEAESLSFSTLEDDVEISLDGRIAVQTEGRQAMDVSGPMTVSGRISNEFDRARLRVSLAAESRDFSLSTQRFELFYADGCLTLTKIKDKAPIDAEIQYYPASGDLNAAVRMEGFVPSKSISLGKNFEGLRPWLSIPYSGTLSLKVPKGDFGRLWYGADVSGSLPEGFLAKSSADTRLDAEIKAQGTWSSIAIERARIESADLKLEYRGDVRFADLSINGTADLEVGLLDGRLPVKISLRIEELDGEYSVVADSADVAGVLFSDIVILASRKAEVVDFRASARPPEIARYSEHRQAAGFAGEAGTGGGRLPSIIVEGSVSFGASPSLELALNVGELYTDPLGGIVAAVTGSHEIAAITEGFSIDFELFATSDFKRLSWSAPEIRISSKNDAHISAVLSLAGGGRSVSIKNAVLSLGGYTVKGSGSFDTDAEKGVSFDVRLDLEEIPYYVQGRIDEGGVAIKGDYELEINATTGGDDVYFSASTRDLPLSAAGSVFLASIDITGRFRNLSDWNIMLSQLDIVPVGEHASDYPSVGLSGFFGPNGGSLASIRISDKISTVTGDATVDYDFEGGLRGSLAAVLNGVSAKSMNAGGESYAVSAKYDDGGYRGEIEIRGFPLARLKGIPISGALDGRMSFSGQDKTPTIDFSARLREGAFQDQALSLSISGTYADEQLAVTALDAAYQGYRLSDVRARYSPRSGGADIEFVASGSFFGQPVSYSIAARGRGAASGTGTTPFDSYSIDGSVRRVGADGDPWPFAVTVGNSGIVLRAGGSDELLIDYSRSSRLIVRLGAPLPIRLDAVGTFDGKNIDVVAKDIDIDMKLFQYFVDTRNLVFESGKVRGAFRAYGLAADPEIEGELAIDDAVLRVPEWIVDPIGPFDAPVVMSERSFGAAAKTVPVGKAFVDAQAQGVFDHWLPSELSASISSAKGSLVRLAFVVLGIKADGEAVVNLRGSLDGDVFHFDVDVAFDKAVLVVTPEVLGPSAAPPPQENIPVFLDLSARLRFGRGVRVFFPYKDNPVVTAYSEPSSSLQVMWDQSTQEYSVKGEADLRGGEVFYIQRNFFLKSGKLVFNEETGMFDPRVTLLAELRERNDEGPVLITLRADNMPISTFKPRLLSDPTMSEAQIALLLGQNLLGISENESLDLRKAIISSSEFLPQLDIAKAFENKVRDMAGLDILFLRTQVLQRWLIDMSGSGEGGDYYENPIGRYLDRTELYAGKYVSDSIFAYGSARLREDPLAGALGLRIDSEFGVELDTPFGLLQWTIAPNHWDDLLISDQSLSLSWKLSY